jgi:hypothetical protein
LPLWSDLTVTGNFNLSMMLKLKFQKNKCSYEFITEIKGLYIRVKTPYTSSIEKVIPPFPPPRKLIPYTQGN